MTTCIVSSKVTKVTTVNDVACSCKRTGISNKNNGITTCAACGAIVCALGVVNVMYESLMGQTSAVERR